VVAVAALVLDVVVLTVVGGTTVVVVTVVGGTTVVVATVVGGTIVVELDATGTDVEAPFSPQDAATTINARARRAHFVNRTTRLHAGRAHHYQSRKTVVRRGIHVSSRGRILRVLDRLCNDRGAPERRLYG
jgi:hypothetical protein